MVQLAHTAPLYAVFISSRPSAPMIDTDTADDTCPADDDGMP